MATLATPALSPAPASAEAHIKRAIRVLISIGFLYTYTEMKPHVTRRGFLAAAPLAANAATQPEPVPSWPVFDQTEETGLLDTLRSGRWYRGSGKAVNRFEEEYAKLTGAKYCLA